jgi:hypothetical protein
LLIAFYFIVLVLWLMLQRNAKCSEYGAKDRTETYMVLCEEKKATLVTSDTCREEEQLLVYLAKERNLSVRASYIGLIVDALLVTHAEVAFWNRDRQKIIVCFRRKYGQNVSRRASKRGQPSGLVPETRVAPVWRNPCNLLCNYCVAIQGKVKDFNIIVIH